MIDWFHLDDLENLPVFADSSTNTRVQVSLGRGLAEGPRAGRALRRNPFGADVAVHPDFNKRCNGARRWISGRPAAPRQGHLF
jgi:hypothetical protein